MGTRVPVFVLLIYAKGTNFSELGIFFTFNPPTLIIYQMEVKRIGAPRVQELLAEPVRIITLPHGMEQLL